MVAGSTFTRSVICTEEVVNPEPESMIHPPMKPLPGARLVHYVGDRVKVELGHPNPDTPGWRGLLRTNLTRGARTRAEVVELAGVVSAESRTFAGASWRDIPLTPVPGGWELDLPLAEVGFFRAKAYCVDPEGRQHWPEGADIGISVHPNHLRTGNTLYCAFPRMFGATRHRAFTSQPSLEEQLRGLDERGFTVIPPSGTLRELTACVPHIIEGLGCRILHLLPLGPTPTTYARMGRYGSPYAQLDLVGIDPALVEFDRHTTAEDQFRELAYATHLRGGLVLLDIVINHTGWGSRLMQEHPEWFKRDPDGRFHSPGAWGVTWGDLVELDNRFPELWEATARALLTWCRRGVDGFRCDAGYMVPVAAWQYLVARVREEFPDTVFLLEGLGGAWEATEALLTEGGMQWAYSELFQNYGPREVASYLDHAIRQGARLGPLVHYSETHDNDRLAKRGARWSLLRNRLSALTSHSGAFAFTSGVEWLATEKIEVHQSRGLAWGADPNLVPELARLNRLLRDHPCFFDGARLHRLSPDDSPILALGRHSAEGVDACLVLVNLDPDAPHSLELEAKAWRELGEPLLDLLDQEAPSIRTEAGPTVLISLPPGASHCLSSRPTPQGLHGETYRARRAQAAWAYRHLLQILPAETLGPAPWPELAQLAGKDPLRFLAALPRLDAGRAAQNLMEAIHHAIALDGFAPVLRWSAHDLNRVLPAPPGHWILVEDPSPFEVTLRRPGRRALHLRSVPWDGGHMAAIFPAELSIEGSHALDAELILDRFTEQGRRAIGALRLLPACASFEPGAPEGLALLTNGRGGMARLHADLGRVNSKYDCLLGANLHPSVPCDRHILLKRVRVWANADGFITALDGRNLVRFEPGPPATWIFAASAGDGRAVEIHLTVGMLPGRNTTVLRFQRPKGAPQRGEELPADRRVSLTMRLDLEDRSFHGETRGTPETEAHFAEHTRTDGHRCGFVFEPAPDRTLRVWLSSGTYHPDPEWSRDLWHALESTRGMTDRGDGWSPGWFEAAIKPSESLVLVACADPEDPPSKDISHMSLEASQLLAPDTEQAPKDSFGRRLRLAAEDFLAHRGEGTTVIAGYPWFLDWGRDTLIACRGLLAGGFADEARGILLTFAQFEHQGTLPNMLSAESTANRDTSDAPLWFGLACEEAAARLGSEFYDAPVGDRRLRDVLASIGAGYCEGTPNGIRVDPASGLVWSPSHFTWMDTNYPAGTPREGYPIEIQALWIRLLRQLGRLEPERAWNEKAALAEASLSLFWREDQGCCHDTLLSPSGGPAAEATPDGHLRPNQLFAAALGLLPRTRAARVVEACGRHLLVPGALRSLAPLSVTQPLVIRASDGHPLNDPLHPYFGRYEGDEDTRRKPAYHNGTAWNWLLPVFCEALAQAHDFHPKAVAAAKAYLGSAGRLLHEGCVGHLPEILDGDAPHQTRGCDAQAWSVTEALRVWLLLEAKIGETGSTV
jgi:predicted glycogen debranching enzyme